MCLLKKSLIFLLISISFLFLSCKKEAKISFLSSEINLGEVKINTDKNVSIDFSNIGDSVLIIKNVTTSCKCIPARVVRKKIMPNQKSKLYFTFKADELGEHTESIVVVTNDEKKFYIIHIKATVI